ncbi:hypothetical protein [Fodinicurvata sp. EGI_FJ10296]|uniref:hypothetical protein n=1 Tax=Fodinicurvata sp. EGI_FJ10296 TaxID=3231908 RepID=UPI003453F2C6
MALILFVLMASVLVDIAAPRVGMDRVAAIALLVFLPCAWRQYGIKEVGIATAAAASAVILLASSPPADAVGTILAALANGARLVALILCLTFLRNAAAASPLVARTGRYLARQPPGRRYLALSAGGHLFGLMLNFGVINLLGPVVRESGRTTADATAEDRRRALIRRRRMMVALIRGFSLVMVWSPASVAQAVLITSVAGLAWIDLVPYTLTWVAVVWALGWLQDRIAWHRARQRPSGTVPGTRPFGEFHGEADAGQWRDLAGLCAITAGMLGCVVLLNAAAGLSLLQSVMTAAPIFAVIWLGIQPQRATLASRSIETWQTLRNTVRHDLPAQGREVALLGSAGFIGVALPALIPSDVLVGIVDPAVIAQPVAGVVMMAAVIIGGTAGISPLIMVPILGGLLTSLPVGTVDPVFAGLAISAGWGLCNGSTPFAASAVLAGRFVDSGPERVVWRWNGAFTVLAMAVCALFLFAISPLLPPG